MKLLRNLLILTMMVLMVSSFSLAETTLSSCDGINASGEYGIYSDITFYSDILAWNKICYDIAFDDVVLDCHGHSVYDIGSTDSGIFARMDGVNNVTIKNCILASYNTTFLVNDSDYIRINDNVIERANIIAELNNMDSSNTLSFFNNDVQHYGKGFVLTNSEEMSLDIMYNNFLYNAFVNPKLIVFENDSIVEDIIKGIDSNYFRDYEEAYPDIVYRYLLDDNNNGIYDYTELTNNVYICYDGWDGGNETCSDVKYETSDLSGIAVDGFGRVLFEMLKWAGIFVLFLVIGYIGSVIKYRHLLK